MGLNIQIKGVTFTKKIGSLLPSGDNLIGYWTFNNDLSSSIINKITGVSGTLVGSPTVLNGKILTDRQNGFITDISISGEKTFVVVSKFSSRAILLGSTDYDRAGTSTSEGIAVANSKPAVQLNGASNPLAPVETDLNTVHFVAGALGTSSNSLYVSAGGVIQETVGATHGGSLDDPNNLRIGGWGVVSTALVGTAEVYEALVFNKKLSAAEIQAVFDYLKSKLNEVIID